jgi:translation initiation factor IF-2
LAPTSWHLQNSCQGSAPRSMVPTPSILSRQSLPPFFFKPRRRLSPLCPSHPPEPARRPCSTAAAPTGARPRRPLLDGGRAAPPRPSPGQPRPSPHRPAPSRRPLPAPAGDTPPHRLAPAVPHRRRPTPPRPTPHRPAPAAPHPRRRTKPRPLPAPVPLHRPATRRPALTPAPRPRRRRPTPTPTVKVNF